MRAAGFRVLAHLEDGPFGVRTSRLNLPDVPVHQDPAAWPLGSLGRVDLVYCNPPCSPWSTAGIVRGLSTAEQTDWRAHPKAACVARCLTLLTTLRPLVWCFESVRQVHSRGGEMLDDMVRSAAGLGYSARDVFVEALHHGVPQHRRRYFLVLTRIRVDWIPPPEGPDPTVDGVLARADRGDDDAVARVPSSVAAIVGRIGRGQNARAVWDHMVRAGHAPDSPRPAFIYDRMAGDRPSYTLLGSPNKLHPREDRMLSVNESRALCGYPDDFRFVGSLANRYAQVGKGVCPPVARWLADNLVVAVRGGVPAGVPTRQEVHVVRGSVSLGPLVTIIPKETVDAAEDPQAARHGPHLGLQFVARDRDVRSQVRPAGKEGG